MSLRNEIFKNSDVNEFKNGRRSKLFKTIYKKESKYTGHDVVDEATHRICNINLMASNIPQNISKYIEDLATKQFIKMNHKSRKRLIYTKCLRPKLQVNLKKLFKMSKLKNLEIQN